MRDQPTQVRTGAVNKRIMLVVSGVLVLLIIFCVGYVVWYDRPYEPPAFDASAQTGTPSPPEGSGYGSIEAGGLFSFLVVGAMYQQQDGSLALYFTNPEVNEVNLQCEVFDEQGETLYRSGAIRPGEYVERLKPLKLIPNEPIKIDVKIYAFEPDTWYSRGSVSLSNVLQAY